MRIEKETIKILYDNITENYKFMAYVQNNYVGYDCILVHKKLKEKRQMKMIPLNSQSRKEIDNIKAIQHKNLIKTYEIYEDRKNYFIVSEVIKGLDVLEFFAKKNNITEENIKEIVLEILNFLKYLHDEGYAFWSLFN